MVTLHQYLVRDLQQGLRQLTELKDIVSIDKFITDGRTPLWIPSAKQYDELCVRCLQSRPQLWLGLCTHLS